MTWPAPDRYEKLADTLIGDPDTRNYAYIGNCGGIEVSWSCCGPTLRLFSRNHESVHSLSNEEAAALATALTRGNR